MAEEFSNDVVKRFTVEVASRLGKAFGAGNHGADAQFARLERARAPNLDWMSSR